MTGEGKAVGFDPSVRRFERVGIFRQPLLATRALDRRFETLRRGQRDVDAKRLGLGDQCSVERVVGRARPRLASWTTS